ncbi:hypothetical protein Hanom_Chr12g01092401 [Helianthus anomalus]
MHHYDVTGYTDSEINDKLLDALLTKWDIHALMNKNEPKYSTKDLEEVVGKLRSYELNIKKKETRYDQLQDPGMYYGISSSTRNASSDSTIVFLSTENEPDRVITYAEGDACFVDSSEGSTAGKRQQGGDHGRSNKSMPLSVKYDKEYLALLVSFVASYENCIQGKIYDPAIFEEDYDQIDADDLEEMDLQ